MAPGRLILVLVLNPYKWIQAAKLEVMCHNIVVFFPRVEPDLNRGDVQHSSTFWNRKVFLLGA